MRKTRFFYGKKLFLTVLLVWLALLNEAVSLDLEYRKEDSAHEQKGQRPSRENKESLHEKQEAKKEQEEEKIRVVLMDTDYQSYYHPSVTLICQGSEKTYTADSPELEEGTVILDGGEEGICVSSIWRQEGNPVYHGTLEISKKEEGLLLVNEILLEEYLKAVVPSEMPSSYEPQALMAQAVCARTYAYRQLEEGRMEEYGADVDDSVNFQVYRNIGPNPKADKAVEDTRGQVLSQNGKLIQAYYFSTSAGMTSTDEIWGAREAASYLKSVKCTFDENMPWSRWEVTLPWERLSKKAEEVLGREDALSALEVFKKSQSGAVTGLRIIGENNTVILEEEYGIREFLSPKDCDITAGDGSVSKGGVLLPSAYFEMAAEPGKPVKIQGRGYGHGVGMSQNGANVMAEQGYTYEEILDYFFRNVDLSVVS